MPQRWTAPRRPARRARAGERGTGSEPGAGPDAARDRLRADDPSHGGGRCTGHRYGGPYPYRWARIRRGPVTVAVGATADPSVPNGSSPPAREPSPAGVESAPR